MEAHGDAEAVEGIPVEERDDDGAETAIEEENAGGFDSWRRESALGAVGTGLARGLQAVFAPPAHEIAIVAEVPGEPPDADQRLQVILDPEDPTKSVAIVPRTAVDRPPE